MDEAMLTALLEYGLTIQEQGWKVGEPLIEKYSKQFKEFQLWAHAFAVTLRAYELVKAGDSKNSSPVKGMVFHIEESYVPGVRKWQKEHPCKTRGQYHGAIGGVFTFSFTNTSIGQVQKLKCGCGQSLLISDDL